MLYMLCVYNSPSRDVFVGTLLGGILCDFHNPFQQKMVMAGGAKLEGLTLRTTET